MEQLLQIYWSAVLLITILTPISAVFLTAEAWRNDRPIVAIDGRIGLCINYMVDTMIMYSISLTLLTIFIIIMALAG